MAYERVAGPLGGKRIDIGAALVSAVLANVNRAKGAPVFQLEDFLPEWGIQPAAPMSPDQIWSAVEQAHKAFTMRR